MKMQSVFQFKFQPIYRDRGPSVETDYLSGPSGPSAQEPEFSGEGPSPREPEDPGISPFTEDPELSGGQSTTDRGDAL